MGDRCLGGRPLRDCRGKGRAIRRGGCLGGLRRFEGAGIDRGLSDDGLA